MPKQFQGSAHKICDTQQTTTGVDDYTANMCLHLRKHEPGGMGGQGGEFFSEASSQQQGCCDGEQTVGV